MSTNALFISISSHFIRNYRHNCPQMERHNSRSMDQRHHFCRLLPLFFLSLAGLKKLTPRYVICHLVWRWHRCNMSYGRFHFFRKNRSNRPIRNNPHHHRHHSHQRLFINERSLEYSSSKVQLSSQKSTWNSREKEKANGLEEGVTPIRPQDMAKRQ
jgi:hypothetical protein